LCIGFLEAQIPATGFFGFRKDWINGFGFIWIEWIGWFFLGLDWFGFFLDLDMLLRISDVKVCVI
jgi:hypothetical protein